MRTAAAWCHRPPATAWAFAAWLAAPGEALATPPVPQAGTQAVSWATRAPTGDVALVIDGRGRLVHRGDGFNAIIRPDGTVEFHEQRVQFGVTPGGGDPTRRGTPPPRDSPGMAAMFERAVYPMGQLPILFGAGARFGGLADGPPERRHTRAKRAFLRATEAMRLRMKHAWQDETIRRALIGLGGHLSEIWHDPTLSLAERKRLLFDLWDECEAITTPALTAYDAARVAGGMKARAKIEKFIRLVAPLGSAHAFSDAEIAYLNRVRTGVPAFHPYEPPKPPAQSEDDVWRDEPPPEPWRDELSPEPLAAAATREEGAPRSAAEALRVTRRGASAPRPAHSSARPTLTRSIQ